MLPSRSIQAAEVKGNRVNLHDDPSARSRNAKRTVGGKPRGAIRKAGAPASSVESRLIKAARIAFRLGGED